MESGVLRHWSVPQYSQSGLLGAFNIPLRTNINHDGGIIILQLQLFLIAYLL